MNLITLTIIHVSRNRTQKHHEEVVHVKRTVVVSRLIAELIEYFNLPLADYELYILPTAADENYQQAQRRLDPSLSIAENGIQGNVPLLFVESRRSGGSLGVIAAAIEKGYLDPIGQTGYYLRDADDDNLWAINEQPAVIGRRANSVQDIALVVDLSHKPDYKLVSRQHACITEENGFFYLYALSPYNPTFVMPRDAFAVRQREMKLDDPPYHLSGGEIIRVANVKLYFENRPSNRAINR